MLNVCTLVSKAPDSSLIQLKKYTHLKCSPQIDLFGLLTVVPNSNLAGLRFFVYCICILMLHSHLNDMEFPETKRFIPKGFELGTTLS